MRRLQLTICRCLTLTLFFNGVTHKAFYYKWYYLLTED